MVSIIFIFAPNFGEGSHFDVHIFQRGRNHQLDKAYDVCWLHPPRIDESLQFRIRYFNGSRIRDLSLAANGNYAPTNHWLSRVFWEMRNCMILLWFSKDDISLLYRNRIFPNQHYRHDMFVVTHSEPHIPKMSFQSWGIRRILDIF